MRRMWEIHSVKAGLSSVWESILIVQKGFSQLVFYTCFDMSHADIERLDDHMICLNFSIPAKVKWRYQFLAASLQFKYIKAFRQYKKKSSIFSAMTSLNFNQIWRFFQSTKT